jgi:hypothetical protein
MDAMPAAATVIDHCHRIKRVMLHVDRHLDSCCRLADLAEVARFSDRRLIDDRVMGWPPS